MYKSPCKKKAGMGDEMTFRTSDILIGGKPDHYRADRDRPFGRLPVRVVFFDCNGSAAGRGGNRSAGGDIIVCNIQTDTKTGHSR